MILNSLSLGLRGEKKLFFGQYNVTTFQGASMDLLSDWTESNAGRNFSGPGCCSHSFQVLAEGTRA